MTSPVFFEFIDENGLGSSKFVVDRWDLDSGNKLIIQASNHMTRFVLENWEESPCSKIMMINFRSVENLYILLFNCVPVHTDENQYEIEFEEHMYVNEDNYVDIIRKQHFKYSHFKNILENVMKDIDI